MISFLVFLLLSISSIFKAAPWGPAFLEGKHIPCAVKMPPCPQPTLLMPVPAHCPGSCNGDRRAHQAGPHCPLIPGQPGPSMVSFPKANLEEASHPSDTH